MKTTHQIVLGFLKAKCNAQMMETSKANTQSVWIAREGLTKEIIKSLNDNNYHDGINYVLIKDAPFFDYIIVVVKDETDYSKGLYQFKIKEWKR